MSIIFKSVEDIVHHLNLSFIGKNKIIKGIQTLKNATEDDLTFYSNPKYMDALLTTKAGACLIKEADADFLPDDVTKVICKDPYLVYAYVLDLFFPLKGLAEISNTASIAESAKIGKDCSIGDHSFIGDNVIIGNNVRIGHNVTLINCEIGDDCIIHSGVRVGQDGFGFTMDKNNTIKKIQQLGKVIIGKDVEVGANTCIDRGAIANTIIGDNTKIDNLVQIGHNVVIGKSCIICAQVGIAGSATIGDYVMIGGQAGINGHITIGSMVQIAAKSGVIGDVRDKEKIGGIPAVSIIDWHRQTMFLRNSIKKK